MTLSRGRRGLLNFLLGELMRNVLLMAICTCGSLNAVAADDLPGLPAQPVANFTLQDFRGKSHSLADVDKSHVVVLAFLGTECPLAKLYAPRLVQLADTYADKPVSFFGINSNRHDSNSEIAAYARAHKVPFPILKDVGNHLADQLNAERTPEVFVLDAQRKVRYRGRIDDQYGVGYIRDEPEHESLRLALDALLAGKPVAMPITAPVGCLIGRVREPDANSRVTYAGQIAAILNTRCVECHRPGQIAPFSLTEYEEVAGWAETIDEVIRDNRMPPWHAHPDHGKFQNDRRLTEREQKLISEWVAAGAPAGDLKSAPPPLEFAANEWQLPQAPDVVIPMRSEPFRVPAEGVVRYRYFSVDPEFGEDRWVRAAEIVPGNRAVVHHVLVFVRPPRDRRSLQDVELSGFLAAYVPGMRTAALPDGMAKFIPAGSQLLFQVHYTPIGTEQLDLSKLGLVFTDAKNVTHSVMTSRASERSFQIPPHADNHRVEATSGTHRRDVQLLSMSPHMHLRGKSFRYEAVFPDGEREILLDVPHYDFNWQTSYQLAEPRSLPEGTRIHCVAHFDNSEENLANPDPTNPVRWGDQTWEEMMIGFFDIAVPLGPEAADDGTKKQDEAQPAAQRVQRIVRRFDANGDGRVGREEIPERVVPLFNRLDINGDGQVTAEEIRSGLRFLPAER